MAKSKDKKSLLIQIQRKGFEEHRLVGHEEFLLHRRLQGIAKKSKTVRHYVFDFAEKVLLPRLLHQPGQLHFTIGLKFDINGVQSSNSRQAYVFSLPEGHCPNVKSANVVISKFFHTMNLDVESRGRSVCTLYLTCDHCGGQNKNRYLLWFLAWLVIIGK